MTLIFIVLNQAFDKTKINNKSMFYFPHQVMSEINSIVTI